MNAVDFAWLVPAVGPRHGSALLDVAPFLAAGGLAVAFGAASARPGGHRVPPPHRAPRERGPGARRVPARTGRHESPTRLPRSRRSWCGRSRDRVARRRLEIVAVASFVVFVGAVGSVWLLLGAPARARRPPPSAADRRRRRAPAADRDRRDHARRRRRRAGSTLARAQRASLDHYGWVDRDARRRAHPDGARDGHAGGDPRPATGATRHDGALSPPPLPARTARPRRRRRRPPPRVRHHGDDGDVHVRLRARRPGSPSATRGRSNGPAHDDASRRRAKHEALIIVGVLGMFLLVVGDRLPAVRAHGRRRPPTPTSSTSRQAVDVEVRLSGRARHERRADRARSAARSSSRMTSRDVIHSFYVPAFRVKQDVLAGPLHDGVVRGDEAGHVPDLVRRVLRRQPLADARRGRRALARGLRGVEAQRGRQTAQRTADAAPVVQRRRPRRDRAAGRRRAGCVACHTLDGQPHIGPTWAGLYGRSARSRTAARSSPTRPT